MPTNMYGPNDTTTWNCRIPARVDPQIPRAKVAHAQTAVCWGQRLALREFLYSDIWPCLRVLMQNYSEEQFINVGYGSDIPIGTWPGSCNASSVYRRSLGQPTGWDPAKMMDSSRLFALGWKPQVDPGKLVFASPTEIFLKDSPLQKRMFNCGCRIAQAGGAATKRTADVPRPQRVGRPRRFE